MKTHDISTAEPARPALRPEPSKEKLYLAFASIYIIWGSTYLAIRYAVQTMPPFLMAGTRFLLAGSLLFAWKRLRGAPAPVRLHWRSAAIAGSLLFLCGNGALCWSEERVPSGLAALLLSTIPIWMVVLETLRPNLRLKTPAAGARIGSTRFRLTPRIIAGLVLGLGGIVLLVGPTKLFGHGQVDSVGATVLLGAGVCWAAGSLISRQLPLPSSTLVAAAMEMITGGVMLIILGIAVGEARDIRLQAVSLNSLLGLIYLISFGSLVGFTSYNWLLTHSSPARVSTYAYVNPVVAVFLGWLMAGEAITLRTLAATLVVVSAVALIISHPARLIGQSAPSEPDEDIAALVPPE